ncbi:ArgS-related anticodon-binding protein NrtL [Streptomyces sp. NPDC050674]|uniref:ArgS-related anticodon-binding protein NrtL n=1 Tax=Streptomyces sp. NPDC050674 TaxID=3157216 RepID=UPI0034199D14
MTPAELSRTVLHAVRRAVDEGELSVSVPERAVVAPPGPGGRGDYASTIALQLARAAGRPPRDVAEVLRARLLDEQRFADVVVTGPGFLNFSLHGTASGDLVDEILRRGRRYGHATSGFSGSVLQIYCRAEVRAVVVTDVVARLARSQGDIVRVKGTGRPAPEWKSVLGADITTRGPRLIPDRSVTVSPVPAPLDPVPLGRDAARWALLHPAAHDRPRIPGDHLVQRESNPLFRVRYAHARTRALLRNAADLGFHPEPGPVSEAGALLAVLGDHPRVLAATATHHTPDRLARHLVTVADAAMPLFPSVLPRGEEKPSAAHRARLALAEAAGTVLAGGLSLLGIDAPDHL